MAAVFADFVLFILKLTLSTVAMGAGIGALMISDLHWVGLAIFILSLVCVYGIIRTPKPCANG